MKRGGRVWTFGAVVALLVAAWSASLVGGLNDRAGAAVPPPVVREYATYPGAVVPLSCRSTPAKDVLAAVRFSVDGIESASLRSLPIVVGSVVTMRWDGFAPGCEGVGVGISDKVNNAAVFDHLANQYGSDGAYCGPGGDPCMAPYELRLTVAARGGFTCFQVDAHIGPQLAVIGPAGSFYEFNNVVYPTLISAFNGGTEPCRFTICVGHPDLPAASIECRLANPESTTTSTEASTSTSASTSTTLAVAEVPSSSSSVVPPTATAATSTDGAVTALAGRVVSAPRALPATGSSRLGSLSAMSALLVASGLTLVRATSPSRGANRRRDLREIS